MLSRGYQGEVYTLNDFKVRRRDFLWLGSVVILSGVLLGVGFWL